MTPYNGSALLKTLTFSKRITMISLKFQKPTSLRLRPVCSSPSFFLAFSLHSENHPPCPRTWCPPAASSFPRFRSPDFAANPFSSPLSPGSSLPIRMPIPCCHFANEHLYIPDMALSVLHLTPKTILYRRHALQKAEVREANDSPKLAHTEGASPLLPSCALFLGEVSWK